MDEKAQIERSVAVERMMAKVMQNHENENKRLWKVVIALIVALAIMACCMIWCVVNVQDIANEAVTNAIESSQKLLDDAMWNALMNAGETTITETMQTVEGDSATINNGTWEQYNDNAVNGGE